MLDEKTKQTVKETIPFLEAKGTEITSLFYKNMLAAHPELLNIFNENNQKKGLQQKALANTVLAAAKHIDDLSVLADYIQQIGYKHRALQVKAEHYPIVGYHLLEAIQSVLGDGATTQIMEAWEKTYSEIAQVFIDVEAEMYQVENWKGFQAFRVISIDKPIAGVIKLGLASTFPIGKIEPGQYVTVRIKDRDATYYSNRHYSVYQFDEATNQIFIAVRVERQGVVSNYLNEKVQLDDEIYLSAPAGDFQLHKDTRHVFISSGIGETPILPMAKMASEENQAVIWIQNYRESSGSALKAEISQLPSTVKMYQNISKTEGRLDQNKLEDFLDGQLFGQFYLCGSPEFTIGIKKALLEIGVLEEKIHYEVFDAPKMSTVFS